MMTAPTKTPSPEPMPDNSTPTPDVAPVIDEAKLHQLQLRLKDEQQLSLGIVMSLGVMFATAVAWSAITYFTEFQIGWMAVGVGWLVGLTMRTVGKGTDPIFGFAGGAIALMGCLLGNLMTVAAFVAEYEQVGVVGTFFSLLMQPAVMIDAIVQTFSPIDLLFYGLAVWFGYKYSFRQLTPEQLAEITRPAR